MEASRGGATVTYCGQEESETEQTDSHHRGIGGFHPPSGLARLWVAPVSRSRVSVVLESDRLSWAPMGCSCCSSGRARICLGALFCLQASSSTRWRSQRWWPALRQWWAAGG